MSYFARFSQDPVHREAENALSKIGPDSDTSLRYSNTKYSYFNARIIQIALTAIDGYCIHKTSNPNTLSVAGGITLPLIIELERIACDEHADRTVIAQRIIEQKRPAFVTELIEDSRFHA